MKDVRWSSVKNKELYETRNITFEQLIASKFIGIEKHPKKQNQKIMLFDLRDIFGLCRMLKKINIIF
ncbi:MAG: hypothetical protein AB7S78_00050 [Candidatus Omnitrophota bacterium]